MNLNEMNDVVEMTAGKQKGIILRYARKDYGSVKDEIFDTIDHIRSAALELDGVGRTFAKSVKFMHKRISEEAWKFQMKYSTKYSAKCTSAVAGIGSNEKTILTKVKAIRTALDKVYSSFP